MKSLLLCTWILAVGCLLLPERSAAHPHVWVTVKSDIIVGDDGTVHGITNRWVFDENYSSFIVLGLDKNKDGVISDEELTNTSVINVQALKDAKFFTFATNGGQDLRFDDATDFSLQYISKRVVLTFTLPLSKGVAARDKFSIRIFDPTFFVSLTLDGAEDAIRAVNLPEQCNLIVSRPQTSEDAKRMIPDRQFFSMAGNKSYGEKFANEAKLECS